MGRKTIVIIATRCSARRRPRGGRRLRVRPLPGGQDRRRGDDRRDRRRRHGRSEDAEAKLRRELLRPLDRPLRATYRDQKWSLPGEKLKVRADIEGAVARAVDVSREGDLPTRIGRYLGGDELEVEISAHVDYSRSAINKFVRGIADDLDRAPRDASVDPTADTLEVVASHPGRKVRDVRLTDELREAVTGGGPRTVAVHVHKTKPEVTTAEVASRYPSYLTLDRGSFTLRLFGTWN